ncbi:hypothetical protein N9M78_01705 [Alphaproteobacteria bacterium]|nr:hypothetical protein [Alphaproteobacteria bacterium]
MGMFEVHISVGFDCIGVTLLAKGIWTNRVKTVTTCRNVETVP